MSEVLSQSQIDALLHSMNQSEPSFSDKEEEPKENQKKYKKYDFFSQKKYSKDKVRLLHNIYENYARIMTSQINSLFRVVSNVEILGVEEQRYYEFSNALYEQDVIALAKIRLPDNSKNPPAILYISPQIMTAMIDRMLGGEGVDPEVGISYSYTELEMALYEGIMKHFISAMGDVWSGHIKFSAQFDRVEENPSVFQGIRLDETVVIIMMKVELLGISGIMNICLPDSLLMNVFAVIDKVRHTAFLDEHKVQEEEKEEIMNHIQASSLEISAELAKANITMEDLQSLCIGDVINLNKTRNSPVTLFINGNPWFTGTLGVHKKNLAVRIEQSVQDAG